MKKEKQSERVLFPTLLLSIRACLFTAQDFGHSSDLDFGFRKAKRKKTGEASSGFCIFHYNTATTSAWHWGSSHSGVFGSIGMRSTLEWHWIPSIFTFLSLLVFNGV